jgi:spoIIIJ-associated protein
VEWVEVAGKTVEEATERALDQLGVAADDAELIVLSEPKTGLFGRVRVEARVRARVRPVGARPRRERPRRNGRSGSGSRQGSGRRSESGGANDSSTSTSTANGSNGSGPADGGARAGTGASRSARRRRNRSNAAARAGERPERASRPEDGNGTAPKEAVDVAEGMTLEEQGEIGRAFVAGLLEQMGMDGSVECRLLDDDTVEVAATGEDLGILVGPRGSTLTALQDLTRAVVQRQCPSRTDRIMVDVAGYRERRSAALKRFSAGIAEEVVASGNEKALEPMSPADRKAVHDAINEMAGVVTRSEGEDPNRFVVIAPAD